MEIREPRFKLGHPVITKDRRLIGEISDWVWLDNIQTFEYKLNICQSYNAGQPYGKWRYFLEHHLKEITDMEKAIYFD